ncbi:hypothetical protein JQX13_38520 [Archangium violaceum]|uniref:DUF5691 domain-containing protein n=1 Tax=Archangium violaceum TaxID=83451 RepID=UPI00193BF282|nr:DUF5691 domain-containing protein [Archangium violaceum]QRK05982.1 hypothetical protein JQX13_38520 [Archangium violaceum]
MNELDALTRLATLGTARSPEPGPTSGVEAQALRALEGLPLEKRLLLAAGVRAVARVAGRKLTRLETRDNVAPPDTLEVCPPRVRSVLTELLVSNDGEVLREAFARMALARRRLPPELLPRVLGLKDSALRAAAEPVLGERGQWLSRLNPEWRPASASPASDLAEAERVWTEGNPDERRAALIQARSVDPARARSWLQGTWAQEKAEHRARFLACLDAGLSPEDEALLEPGRKDRAGSVREVARYLLARLPGSAFAQRMAERARTVLVWEKPATLRVQFPARWDAEAERDGLDKPPPGVGQSEHWLIRLLEAIPLRNWESWFEATPTQIVTAAARTDHGVALSEGWALALRLGASSPWAMTLLGFWSRCESKVLDAERAQSLAVSVLEQLPPNERAARTLRVLERAETLPSLDRALALTPAPWPAKLGYTWLQALRELYDPTTRAVALLGAFRQAAIALPPECLPTAAEPFALPAPLHRWNPELHRFQQTVSLRRILHEELKP